MNFQSKKWKIFSISLSLNLLSSVCLAEDVKYLGKDEPAPYAGYLFTPSKAKELRDTTLERDNLKLINESFAKSITLYKANDELNERKVNKLLEQNDKLGVSLEDARDTSTFSKFMWFGLGVIVTGAAFYGASKITVR